MSAYTERFCVLRPLGGKRFGGRYANFDIEDPHFVGDNQDNGKCPQCGHGIGPRPWLIPQRISIPKQGYPDFLWGATDVPLLSTKVRLLYERSGLTGVEAFRPPVEVLRVGRKHMSTTEQPTSYFVPRLRYDGASVNDLRSEAVRPPGTCPHCRGRVQSLKRVVVEPDSWTGLDIFFALGLPGDVLVTRRFKDMVEQNGLTNAEFVPSEQFGFEY